MKIWQIPPRFLDKNTLFGELYLLENSFLPHPFYNVLIYNKSYRSFRWILVSKEIEKRFGPSYKSDQYSTQQAIDNILISEVKQSFSLDIIRKEISILIEIWELDGYENIDLIEKLSLQSSEDILGENLYLLEIIQKGLINNV